MKKIKVINKLQICEYNQEERIERGYNYAIRLDGNVDHETDTLHEAEEWCISYNWNELHRLVKNASPRDK